MNLKIKQSTYSIFTLPVFGLVGFRCFLLFLFFFTNYMKGQITINDGTKFYILNDTKIHFSDSIRLNRIDVDAELTNAEQIYVVKNTDKKSVSHSKTSVHKEVIHKKDNFHKKTIIYDRGDENVSYTLLFKVNPMASSSENFKILNYLTTRSLYISYVFFLNQSITYSYQNKKYYFNQLFNRDSRAPPE